MSSQGSRKLAQQEVLIGRTLQKGEYVIEAVLGHGGMGQVFLASHAQVDVPVAIKQVRADEPLPPEVIEELDQLLHHKSKSLEPPGGEFPQSGGANTDRFLREALLLARLHHPAIPLLYDYFLENGYWYLVMEYVPGSTLSLYNREHGPLPPLEAVNYALQICDVLEYLHQQDPPVIFRDLKPANIILHPDGRLMMVDFGIARYFKEGQFNDTTDFGSPGYASPEQYEGIGQTDARSDLFSLGVILHEMLSGQRPSRRDVSMEQLEALNKLNPAISPALSGLVMVATRIEPMYRFQSAHTFYQALERVRAVEERRAYRYHTFIAETASEQDIQALPLLVPPPSSQGFLNIQLTHEQDIRSQHMRMREQAQRTPRAYLEQEALVHQLTSIDESLKLRAVSSPLVRNVVVTPILELSKGAVEAAPTGPIVPPALPPKPPAHHSPSSPRKRRWKRWLISAILLILLLSGSLLVYRYLTGNVYPSVHSTSGLRQTRQNVPTPMPTVEEKNVWHTLSALPSQEADNTLLYTEQQGQNVLYLTGGFRGMDASPTYNHGLYRYSLSTARWQALNVPGFPTMGNNAAAQDTDGNLFYTGGYQPDLGTTSSRLYMYQPATNSLHIYYSPPELPLGFGGSMISDGQGHLYITQGFLTPGYTTALAGTGWYRFDIGSSEWHSLASLPAGLGYVQLALDKSGNIILLGGSLDAGQQQPDLHIYTYNTQQNSWSQSNMALPAPMTGSESCMDGQGNLIVVGGYDAAHNQSLNTTWLLNLQSLHWHSLASLPRGGSVLGAAACDGHGHVYITRGANDPSKPTRDFLELSLPAI